MTKIALFCEALINRAGIERMTVELANLLSETHEVTIVTIEHFEFDKCPFKINPRINVVSLESKFAKSIYALNISIIRRLRDIFKQINPTTVITVATPLTRLSVPAVVGLGVRNIAWEHFNVNAGSRLGKIYKIISTWFVDCTVALTKADRDVYRKSGAKRVVEIPNFTTIDRYEPSKCDKKTLLAVGRHVHQKGFDMLIKAWCKTKAPGWTLRIVGDGAEKIENIRLADQLGVSSTIEFIPSTSNISKEFQNASCFVLSSRYEGLVLVLIEAKMMGLPCVSFDCPYSPREIIHDGIDGILVATEDIESLAKELTLLLSNPSRLTEMGKSAREDALIRYSSTAVRNQWLSLIKSNY